MGGVLYQMGERVPEGLLDIDDLRLWTRRLMHANEVNPDPNTSLVIATSTLLGLVAKQRTGRGQQALSRTTCGNLRIRSLVSSVVE